MIAVCDRGSSEACSKMIADAKSYINWYKTFNYGNDFRTTDDFDQTKPGHLAETWMICSLMPIAAAFMAMML